MLITIPNFKKNNNFSSHQITFPSIATFCFGHIDIEFSKGYESEQSEFESIKQEHTNTIIELFTELTGRRRYSILPKLIKTKSVLQEYWNKTSNLYNRFLYGQLKSSSEIIGNNTEFIDLLITYYSDHFTDKDYIKFGIQKEREVKKLGDLLDNLDELNKNQTIAFHNNMPTFVDIIYLKEIVSVSNLTLNRRSKLIYDFRSTSTMYYDIVLPFNDKNYDETSTDCTSASDLPLFFNSL